MGDANYTPEQLEQVKRQLFERWKREQPRWQAEKEREKRLELGFVNYKLDCSFVQCYRMADWHLACSTQFTPVFGGKCNASFSCYCGHCGCYHNFIAKPGLAHVCNVHNRRHDSREDLERLLAEAEAEYIQEIKKACGRA
jgi:hypothetical protein